MAADLALVLPFLLVGAMLYTSVGHGGASIYVAILALAGYAAGDLVATILILNIGAAGIAFVAFQRAGHLRPRLLAPFLLTSVPLAYLGGLVPLRAEIQEVLLGSALLVAAARFLLLPRAPNLGVPTNGWVLWVVAPLLGAALGFLAGATGIGGGVYLSPLLVLMGWADVRQAASIASAFIVLNSAAGLAAHLQRASLDLDFFLPVALVVAAGALFGSFLGARRLHPRALQALLGVVLAAAGLRLFL